MRLRWRKIGSAVAGAGLVSVLGCSPPSDVGAAVSDVVPIVIGPGFLVRVTADREVFGPQGGAFIEIGGQTAAIQNTLSATEVDVLVPNIAAGVADLRIVEPDKVAGSALQVTVVAPQSQRLLLTLEDGVVSLIDAAPRAGGFNETDAEGGRRLSYDLLDSDGALLFTGAIVHPTLGRREVYDEPEPGVFLPRDLPPVASATFVVTIPNLPGGALQFFDVPEGADLGTQEGRAARTLINQINLEG